MLYFSKLKLVFIYSLIIILSFFSFSNFIKNDATFLFSKKVNLGLDLQGGSYLLLEVDAGPAIKEKLQNKVISLRKVFKNKNIKFKKLKLENNLIQIKLLNSDTKLFYDFFHDKDNLINPYLNKYRSYEMDYSISEIGSESLITIKYSKFGLIEIKSSILEIIYLITK